MIMALNYNNLAYITRVEKGNAAAFLVMDKNNNTFGWYWKFYDNGRGFPGPDGKFNDVTVSPELVKEISSRGWNMRMSKELNAFTKELWEKFLVVNPDWRN